MRRLANATLILFVLLLGSPSSPFAGGSATFVDLPVLTLNPNGNTPLSAVVDFTTDIPSEATLRITDGIEVWSVKFPGIDTTHSLPVYGLKPNRTYSVEVSLMPGGATDSSLMTSTAPLPPDFPGLITNYTDPANMEPGYTLIDNVSHGRQDTRVRYAMIVDKFGDVVWYSELTGTSLEQTDSGDLIWRCGSQVCELTLLGVRTVIATLQDSGAELHHDLFRTSHGTYLSLTRSQTEVVDYPTSEDDEMAAPATAMVRDEPAVEFAADGTLLHRWNFAEMIDPRRIGYDSLFGTNLGFDWIHDNAIVHDARDDSVIVSMRHQDAVIKFSRQTGELIWILGTHENWEPAFQQYLLTPVGAPFEWQYHQHAVMVTPQGTLMMFDNGNYRASPFDGTVPFESTYPLDNYSRAVEYEIDETTMEIRQVWEYGSNADEIIYANFVGDVDWLPTTGNVLIHFGGTRVMGGVTNIDLGYGNVTARILEVDHNDPANKVFDLLVYDPEAVQAIVYRSERIPSLYASDVLVTEFGPVAVGSVPDGGDVPGTPLTIDKGAGGDITLAWGQSCVSSDLDYAVYQGILGDFTSHVSAVCSTGGTRTLDMTPDAGSAYYLVVPMNGIDEGSYGAGVAGAERAAAAVACLPQALATCP